MGSIPVNAFSVELTSRYVALVFNNGPKRYISSATVHSAHIERGNYPATIEGKLERYATSTAHADVFIDRAEQESPATQTALEALTTDPDAKFTEDDFQFIDNSPAR